jgi:hypothetical protein
VSYLHSFDATIDELTIQVGDPEDLFGEFMAVASGLCVTISPSNYEVFLLICAALDTRELARQLSPTIAMDNAVDRILLGGDISTDVGFIASHFCDFATGLDELPLPIKSEIVSHPSLTLDNEDFLYDFVCRHNLDLLEHVRLEYCSPETICDMFPEYIKGMSASMWANLRSRLVLPVLLGRQFPPSVRRGAKFDVPDGIIAHLTRECGGNVHDRGVVVVTSSKPFTDGNPLSEGEFAAKNVADLAAGSAFCSAWRDDEENIGCTRNNWICYDFKQRRIMPTHYAIRSWNGAPGAAHPKGWIVETSEDGVAWKEVDRREDNAELNGKEITQTFTVPGSGGGRFIRLVNIGKNHEGDDCLSISAWEIFGSIVE